MKRVLYAPKDRDEIFDRFFAYIEEWKARLVLREWDINVHLETEGDIARASSHCRPKYQDAEIRLCLPDNLETLWPDEEIEDSAVHELMHVLVSTWDAVWQRTHRKPLPAQILNMLLVSEEQVCTRLALGFMRTKYPRWKS